MSLAAAVKNLLTLRCDDAARLASDAQDRQLSWSERWGLRLHVAICAGCRRFRNQLRSIENAARKLGGEAALPPQDAAAARDRISAGLRDRLAE